MPPRPRRRRRRGPGSRVCVALAGRCGPGQSAAAISASSFASRTSPRASPGRWRGRPASSESSQLMRPFGPGADDVDRATVPSGSRGRIRTVASRFAKAAITTRSASRLARIARVPLVVVITSVLPRQTSGVKEAGELPRSNPSIGSPCRSPPRIAVPAGRLAATARASSISPQGITASQPAARAWTITVVARSTSTTTATPPRSAPGGIRPGSRWTKTGGRPTRHRDRHLRARFRAPAKALRLWHADRPLGEPPSDSAGRSERPAARQQSATFGFPRVDAFPVAFRAWADPALPGPGRARIVHRDPTVPSRRGAWMHEPKGSILPITGPRRFIIDLVHFARQVPSTPGEPDDQRRRRCSAARPSTRRGRRGRCCS